MWAAPAPDGGRTLARVLSPWRLDMGAELRPDGVHFHAWAPHAGRVDLAIDAQPERSVPMERQADGTWSVTDPRAGAGARYRYRLDGGQAFPDPYSRSQPDGVHGPSEVVDTDGFTWHDRGWAGRGIKGLAIYQCHAGTATPAGTFDALADQLGRLRSLGLGAVQTLPVAEFPGRWNWGYDGVDLFAPTRVYGGVAGLKRFVDAAHQHGLGVIVDVVYNHFGPDGNYLRAYSDSYFTDRYQTPWGDAVNYDGEQSRWVRKLAVDNALYWIHEYHADGLRLDATHAIHDRSPRHILQEIVESVRQSLPPGRQVVLIAEANENDARYLRPASEGGFGFDAVYADDFHHALRRYLAGDHEGYYRDYAGTLDEVARTVEQGWLYQGQPTRLTGAPRGTPAADRPAWQFQYMLQNHDQVGNRPTGDRLTQSVDLGRYRAASALLLLLPYTPLLFMGQEFAASAPFLYFTDHVPELGRLVTEGRREEFRGWAAFGDPARAKDIPDPQAPETFFRSKLDLAEAGRPPGNQVQELYRELLHLRRDDAVLARQDRHQMRAAALTPDVLSVNLWNGAECRLLLVNFGPPTSVAPVGALAGAAPGRQDAPDLAGGSVLLNTDAARFGGRGDEPRLLPDRVDLPARAAILAAVPVGA